MIANKQQRARPVEDALLTHGRDYRTSSLYPVMPSTLDNTYDHLANIFSSNLSICLNGLLIPDTAHYSLL